MLVMENFQNK